MLDPSSDPGPGISRPPEPGTALREGLGPRHPKSVGVSPPWITGSFLEEQCPEMFEVNPKFQVDLGGIWACGAFTESCGSRPGYCTPFPGNFQSQSGWGGQLQDPHVGYPNSQRDPWDDWDGNKEHPEMLSSCSRVGVWSRMGWDGKLHRSLLPAGKPRSQWKTAASLACLTWIQSS